MLVTAPDFEAENEASRYINRDVSWLSFNERVLANAQNETLPLGERLRFITISAGNLDEFYMVRLAGMLQLRERGYKNMPDEEANLAEVIAQVATRAEALKRDQQKTLGAVLHALSDQGFSLCEIEALTPSESKWLDTHFADNILPLLVPTTLDPAHPFPFIQNRGKGLLLELRDKSDEVARAVILLPENLERFIRLPQAQGSAETRFVLLEQVIMHHLAMIYPGYDLVESGMFRILRDSEIEIDDEADDLINQFESALRARRRGNVVSLVLSQDLSAGARTLFRGDLQVDPDLIFVAQGYVGLGDFSQLLDYLPKQFFYRKFHPRHPQRVIDFKDDCFAAIRNKDFVVHHPYESFDIVLRFLEQAAEDPNVMAIRQTLYRTAPQSKIVSALIAAAEAGKSVIAVIELKARFDEANNIKLARLLERAGVQVAYGLADLKVHSKLSHVIRREGTRLVSYAHCGTGNYHPVTAKIYTDLSFFTCDVAICDDVRHIFNYLTSQVRPDKLQKLIISPDESAAWFAKQIDQEIAAAKEGKPSGIWIKCNAIVDPFLIEKLYEASAAKVPVHMIVRGICGLRPGIKGLSETIIVKSIIGRFLEHGRIFVFANGGVFQSPKNKVYMSSADLMPRNLYKRVEAIIPLENKTVRQQVLSQIIEAQLKDVANSWYLRGDGSYEKSEAGNNAFCAHTYFMKNPSLSGQGSLANHQENITNE